VTGRAAPSRAVFVPEADSTAQSEAHPRAPPLVAAGQFRFELVEPRPFANRSMLFAP
jgi:hypothetical protein